MKPEPKFVNVAIYSPDRTLFAVALRTKNVPGALGDIATRLGRAKVNLLSTSNYTLPDNPESMLSFFAEAKDPAMSEDDLAKVLSPSPFVLDQRVEKSSSGLLTDDFTFPLVFLPGGRGILLPQSGVTAMFQDMVRLFGTGGEAILYSAGASVGRQGVEDLAKMRGREDVLEGAEGFIRMYAALGWGRIEISEADPVLPRYRFRLVDGFESGGAKSTKPRCHFTRGIIAGAGERVFGREMEVAEEECAAAGDPCCVFSVGVKRPAGLSRSGSSSS